jgi:uncharacterized repeat protein (TIGR01451 family)
MKNLLTILTVLCIQTTVFGQSWQTVIPDNLQNIAATNAYDGGYVLIGNWAAERMIKVDAKGNRQWLTELYDFMPSLVSNYIIRTTDSAYLVHGITRDDDFMLKKIDQRGFVVWSKKFPLEYVNVRTYKNDYFLIGKSRTSSSYVLLRLNLNGETISQKTIQGGRYSDFTVQNDGILALSYDNYTILKINFEGQIIVQKNTVLDLTPDNSRIHNARDSNYYATNTDGFLYKLSKQGDTLWKKNYNHFVYSLSNENGMMGGSNRTEIVNGTQRGYAIIEKINKTGNSVWKKRFGSGIEFLVQDIVPALTGGYLIVATMNSSLGSVPVLMKIDENGELASNFIEGKIIKDVNKNCQFDATDTPLNNCIVEAKNNNSGNTFWGLTDVTGRYTLNLDSGAYTLKAYPLTNRNFWQSCTSSVSRTLTSNKKNDTLDFALKTIADCAAMEVSVTTPILRRCFNTTYYVKYCNKGTFKADNAYITVTIDSLLEFVNASKAITSQTGRTYRFNLGTVAVNDCGSFDITTRVRCGDSTRLGQTLCVEAKIFPDSICPPPSTLWSGANIVVSGVCQRDSVLFQIRNTGTAASSQLTSILIEDEVLFLREPIQLPQNGVSTKKFPANGRTWRMVVNQEPNHPTSFNPTAFVEGCRANNNQPFNTGSALLFPNDDRGLVIDVDCRAIVGAYDPNDKAGAPIGYKTQRYIGQNQDIEYLVRFQNTGTDTAFTVVIRDTISEKLDISSIEFGASSHAYDAEIYGKGILKFTFNNILLVDSFKNEPKSHGFVQYRIKQQKDLAVGSQIFNTAYIYFDFNEPVITNRTLHTIGGKEVITAIFDKNETAYVPMTVSPNPFTSTALFETPLSINGNFELYDITGKAVRKERFEGTTFAFQRKELAAGIYIFKIMVNGRPLSIGKLIVQ